MKFSNYRAFGAVSLFAVATTALAIPASAITVSAGDKILDGSEKRYCSVSHTGVNEKGEKVAFTAAHCFKKGEIVKSADGKVIGTVTYRDGGTGSDYAAITLNDQVTEVKNPGVKRTAPAVKPGGINFAQTGKIVTKTGATSGTTYGVTVVGVDRKQYALLYSDAGDSGSVVRGIDGEHVGTISGGLPEPLYKYVTTYSNTGNDIAEYNEANPGAEYTMTTESGKVEAVPYIAAKAEGDNISAAEEVVQASEKFGTSPDISGLLGGGEPVAPAIPYQKEIAGAVGIVALNVEGAVNEAIYRATNYGSPFSSISPAPAAVPQAATTDAGDNVMLQADVSRSVEKLFG